MEAPENALERKTLMTAQKILRFVKYPEPGKVKTRLKPFLGKDLAAKLYGCFVLDLLETLNGAGYALRIAFDPFQGKFTLPILK